MLRDYSTKTSRFLSGALLVMGHEKYGPPGITGSELYKHDGAKKTANKKKVRRE